MKLQELLDLLEEFADECDPDTEVRLAIQPNWPFEHFIGQLTLYDPAQALREESNELDSNEVDEQDKMELQHELFEAEQKPKILYISEAGQAGYLPGLAADALNWGR